ncbi:MAG: hypothetical protein NXY57DRAFT_241497 [Lentinula lateritia]|uniref:Uncharacterized protein n=1 Tax=Lentinula lateritia TaxID=40482 RepID=A0ABQ8V6E7_9AGAR|nr:MAG: hypothetical protein NXY57DRAFT_241497 [Lentinula lateritia]KAJ4475873.1 hypothetical protein C8R41DRAFT_544874 [Lentinula lateritia]
MAPYNHPKSLQKTKSPLFSATTFKRSPLLYRGRVPARRNPPESRSKHVLPIIPEIFGSPDRDRRRSRLNTVYYDPFEQQEDVDEVFNEEERPTFTWENEKTLVSDLLHDGYEQEHEDVKLSSLADSIQAAFSVHSKELLDDVADTLVPAVNLVKHGHQVLNDQVDDSFALGVFEFDEACKKLEAVTISSHNELKKAYRTSQVRIQDLLKQLEEACTRRDRLWVDFEAALDDILNPATNSLKTLPIRMERTIATLEKQSKQIGKDSGSKEKYLKGLLSKFT